MKQLLITIAAVVLVGCGESQQSAPEEAKPVDAVTEVPSRLPSPAELQPAETVTEAVNPEPPTGKVPDISIHDAVIKGDLEAIKQHLAAGTNVNAKDESGRTTLHWVSIEGHKEAAKLLIANGADVNAKDDDDRTPLLGAVLESDNEMVEFLITKGANVNVFDRWKKTPLDYATDSNSQDQDADEEIADLLRKHGAKTSDELKAEGK